jgi:K+-sensing histidine kinase KdpD
VVTDRRGSDATESDATLAVVAHGLLTSLSVIQGANLMLRDDWDRLTEQRRIELINMALLQAQHTIGVLQDLMRGVAPNIAAELDRLAAANKRIELP